MLDFDQITDNLFVGTCPRDQYDVATLQQTAINAVLNLQTDQDLIVNNIDWAMLRQHYIAVGIAPYRQPMIDFDQADIASRLAAVTATLNTILSAGNQVYLHCTAGRERAPTVAVAWLLRYRAMTVDSALQTVRAARQSRPYAKILNDLGDITNPAKANQK